MSGGVALNCSANGIVRRSRLFEKVFVQPAAGDDGTSLGAALFAERQLSQNFKPRQMTVPLWGPEFCDEEISQVLAGRSDCEGTKCTFDALCKDIAGRIGSGQIVAWFQGRMEFGPRALGSRSILADARDPAMRDRINGLVKKREAFRPFAPIVTKRRLEYSASRPARKTPSRTCSSSHTCGRHSATVYQRLHMSTGLRGFRLSAKMSTLDFGNC